MRTTATLTALGIALAGSTLLAAAPAPAAAQTSVYVHTGATVPTGDYAEYYLVSWNASGAIDVAIHEHLAIGARVGYHRASLDGRALLEELGLGGLGLAVDGSAHLLFAMPVARAFWRIGAAELYGIGGVGFARAVEEDVVVFNRGGNITFEGGDEVAVGAQIGAGIRLPSGPFSTFGEVGWVGAFTEASPTTGVLVRVGVSYVLGWVPGAEGN